jgi:hypothetical protein
VPSASATPKELGFPGPTSELQHINIAARYMWLIPNTKECLERIGTGPQLPWRSAGCAEQILDHEGLANMARFVPSGPEF